MLLALAIAGGLGAVARYIVDAILRRWVSTYPVGTLVINVLGSLLLGVLVGLQRHHGLSPDVVHIVGTGFCGGFTTFSTASVEVALLRRERRQRTAAIHLTLMFAACALAAACGLWWAR